MVQEKRQKVAIKEGLFKIPSSPQEKGYLVGVKCQGCGEVFFPRRSFCAWCSSPDLKETPLSNRGKLFTYTIIRQTLPGSAMIAPYAVGQVVLPEGVTVHTAIACDDLNDLKIGMEMDMVIEKIKDNEAGQEVMGFKFKPVAKKR